MAETKQDVEKSESSPELKAALEESAPSTEQQTPETETPTPQQAETQEQVEPQAEEEQRIPYSRFKDVNEEKNWYKQQLEQQLQKPQPQTPISQPQPQDPYQGMTPEERVFWQQQRKIASEEAEKYYKRNVQPIIEAGRQEMARMSVAQFRQRYSDVKPNSPQEIEIAQKIQSGYLPDDAYKVVMWDNKISEAESKSKQTTQHKVQQKRQANVETTGVSQSSQPPPKETYEEELDRRMREAGI